MIEKEVKSTQDTRTNGFWIFCFFCLLFFFACASFASEAVDNETCLTCHDAYSQTLAKGPHALTGTAKAHQIQINCVSCHDGAAVHIDDPSADNIGNPSNLEYSQAEKVCTQCHQPHTTGMPAFDVHADQDIACTNCHGIHSAARLEAPGTIKTLCSTCHGAVTNDFLANSHHPVTEGAVSCISCHDFTGKSEPNFAHGQTATCYGCHPQQSGPYLFEHDAASSFSPEGEGCTACHSGHASTNEKLLKQPNDKICLQCHGEPAGHKTAHNGELTGLACMDCHSQVHGSYDNLYLLDPQLGSKVSGGPDGCFCHYYR